MAIPKASALVVFRPETRKTIKLELYFIKKQLLITRNMQPKNRIQIKLNIITGGFSLIKLIAKSIMQASL